MEFPNIGKTYKRVMAISCNHGNRANANAISAVLLFREQFKPDECIHLGDNYDLASLRAGALKDQNDSDAVDDYMGDLEAGREFLNSLRPTVFILGNHDERAKRYLRHHNAVVRGYAEAVWTRMVEPIDRHCHTFIDTHDVLDRSWYKLGGAKYGHGILFSENFLRDTAETWGGHKEICVVGHAHRAGIAHGRTSGNPVAMSPGCLADISCMEYAHKRRSTLAWSFGIVFGEYTDNHSQLYLHQWNQHETQWNLPSF